MSVLIQEWLAMREDSWYVHCAPTKGVLYVQNTFSSMYSILYVMLVGERMSSNNGCVRCDRIRTVTSIKY